MMMRAALVLSIATLVNGCTTTSGEPELPRPLDCGVGTEPTPGELGVLSFVHDYGWVGCLFGCSADEPLAALARSQVVIVGEGTLPAIRAQTDDPTVAEVTGRDGAHIALATHVPGRVRLEILDDATGALIDALPLEVKVISSIAYSYPSYVSELTVMVGGEERIGVQTFDEQGCRILGVGGVSYAFGGGLSESEVTFEEALAQFLFSGLFSAVSEYVDVDALAVGAGGITVGAPGGVTLFIPLRVVDDTTVARVAVEADQEGVFAVGTSGSIQGEAFTASNEPIYSPGGNWSIAPAAGEISLSATTGDVVNVTATTPSTATVTYRLGTREASVTVRFE